MAGKVNIEKPLSEYWKVIVLLTLLSLVAKVLETAVDVLFKCSR